MNELIPKIIFLQEIWLPYHDQKCLDEYLPDFTFKIATPDMLVNNEDKLLRKGPVWHGCAIGWHKEINSKITALSSNHERLVGIKLNLSKSSILLISLYAPTSGKDDEFLETVSHISSFISLNASSTDYVIIGADMNCSTKSTSRRQEALQYFLSDLSLSIHTAPNPTFHHNNGSSESNIGYFVTSSALVLERLTQFCTLEYPLNMSSHDPIFTKVVLEDIIEHEESRFANTYSELNQRRLSGMIPGFRNTKPWLLRHSVMPAATGSHRRTPPYSSPCSLVC